MCIKNLLTRFVKKRTSTQWGEGTFSGKRMDLDNNLFFNPPHVLDISNAIVHAWFGVVSMRFSSINQWFPVLKINPRNQKIRPRNNKIRPRVPENQPTWQQNQTTGDQKIRPRRIQLSCTQVYSAVHSWAVHSSIQLYIAVLVYSCLQLYTAVYHDFLDPVSRKSDHEQFRGLIFPWSDFLDERPTR